MAGHLDPETYGDYEIAARYTLRGIHMSWKRIPAAEYDRIEAIIIGLNEAYSHEYNISMNRNGREDIYVDLLYRHTPSPSEVAAGKGVGNVYSVSTSWSGP